MRERLDSPVLDPLLRPSRAAGTAPRTRSRRDLPRILRRGHRRGPPGLDRVDRRAARSDEGALRPAGHRPSPGPFARQIRRTVRGATPSRRRSQQRDSCALGDAGQRDERRAPRRRASLLRSPGAPRPVRGAPAERHDRVVLQPDDTSARRRAFNRAGRRSGDTDGLHPPAVREQTIEDVADHRFAGRRRIDRPVSRFPSSRHRTPYRLASLGTRWVRSPAVHPRRLRRRHAAPRAYFRKEPDLRHSVLSYDERDRLVRQIRYR